MPHWPPEPPHHLSSRALLIDIWKGVQAIMADLTGVNDAIANLQLQITQLAAQVGELQAGTVTQEELDDIAGRLAEAAGAIDAIVEPDEGEAV